jgi:hypothetical protein
MRETFTTMGLVHESGVKFAAANPSCGGPQHSKAAKAFVSIETRSLPSSLGACPRAFAFYLAHPVRSIRVHSWLILTLKNSD